MTGGLLFAYSSDVVAIVSDIKIIGPRCSDNVFPYTACAPKFDADKRQKDIITDIGDASVVLTAASRAMHYQNVTLTANRTITPAKHRAVSRDAVSPCPASQHARSLHADRLRPGQRD